MQLLVVWLVLPQVALWCVAGTPVASPLGLFCLGDNTPKWATALLFPPPAALLLGLKLHLSIILKL